jgi:hypothetical protein
MALALANIRRRRNERRAPVVETGDAFLDRIRDRWIANQGPDDGADAEHSRAINLTRGAPRVDRPAM